MSRRKIALVIDDEPLSLDFLAEATDLAGYKSVRFPDPLTALRYLGRYKATINLILIDYRLPGIDGLTFAQRARGMSPSCPLVLISNYAQIQDVERGYEVGVDDFIVRPIDKNELVGRLGKAVERRKKLSEHLVDKSEQVLKKLNFDPKKRAIDWFGKRIALTPRELQIIQCLTAEPGRYYRYPDIYLAVYGLSISVPEARAMLIPMIRRLRAKLEEGGLPRVIEGKRLSGLRWNDESIIAFQKKQKAVRRKRETAGFSVDKFALNDLGGEAPVE